MQNITFWVLCQAKVKAVKVLAQAMKVAEKESKRKSARNGSTATKKPKCMKAPVAIICELHRLAAFQAQLYIFTKAKKSKADIRFALTKDHFHGNPDKRIQGACAQLIEGVGAFQSLYNCTEGEINVELVLKPSYCSKYDSSVYIAGVHFIVDDINTFAVNKKIKGRALWNMGLSVLQSIKKALSIGPKLLPRIVIIDKNCAVVGYASGKNESSFLQHIDNGMFALITKEGGSLLLEDTSDDNSEILGATSEEGMPMMHDDRYSIDSSSDDVVVVDFDPFGGIAAPRGYTYIGKLAFICFGPASKFFASTLAMGGQSERSAEEKKEGSMRSIRKITKA
jgi:hypothetical protein